VATRQNFQKGQILALGQHFSHEDIGCQLGIFRRTVSNLDRVQKRNSIDSLPRPVHWEDSVMYDHEDDRDSEEKLPPSNVMWETVLT
jgi:hypothetical protein